MRRDIKFGHIISEKDLQIYIEDIVGDAGELLIIKPNWTNSLPTSLPHFEALKKLLNCLKEKELIVTESYTAWRNRLYRQHFMDTGNMEWEENVKPHNAKVMWEWLRKEEEWFLDFFGFRKWFQKYNVDYVNVTEEVWNQRTAPAEKVKACLGDKKALVKNTRLFDMVPEKFMELKGCTLLNFTKLYKTGIYAAKNMMGLIPDPNRTEYHGKNDSKLIQNIHDINIIYRSLFTVVDVVESIVEHQLILSGSNPALLDEVGCVVLEFDLADPYHDVLKAREVFGSYPLLALSEIPDFICEGLKKRAESEVF
ncbi:MAG: DUF362 domain-containing protein [Theionarchaea archaeon]|nr:DUF362 domain-containing protein [Theionarchaea archaeon]